MKMNKNEIKMSPEEELDLFIDALIKNGAQKRVTKRKSPNFNPSLER
jgi:hypothetical protein